MTYCFYLCFLALTKFICSPVLIFQASSSLGRTAPPSAPVFASTWLGETFPLGCDPHYHSPINLYLELHMECGEVTISLVLMLILLLMQPEAEAFTQVL